MSDDERCTECGWPESDVWHDEGLQRMGGSFHAFRAPALREAPGLDSVEASLAMASGHAASVVTRRVPASAPAAEEREPAEHELKVWPQYGDALDSGVKTFEFRKDDRTPRFEVGDVLALREWTPPYRAETEHEWSKQFGGDFTGREWFRRVTYVARGGVIPEGYCVMSIEPLAAATLRTSLDQVTRDARAVCADYDGRPGQPESLFALRTTLREMDRESRRTLASGGTQP